MRVSRPPDALDGLLTSMEAGGELDSQGVFTLAGRRAAGKLARELLSDPADWILKVVQSVCRAKASELSIHQTGKSTHFAFSFPFALDLRALELSLTQAQAASQPGVEELATALRVVGLAQERAWVLRVVMGAATHWIVVNRGEVSVEMGSEGATHEGGTDLLLGIAYPPGQAGKVGGLVRFGAAVQQEHEALLSRTRACPVRLLLDGVRLDDMARTEGLATLENELFLGLTMGQHPSEREPISWPQGVGQQKASWFTDRLWNSGPFYLPELKQSEGSSLLRVAYRFQEEGVRRGSLDSTFRSLMTSSRVVLVRHGVVVGRRNLGISAPIGVEVYLCADQDVANLSGLEVDVQPTHLNQALAELTQLGPFLRELQFALASYTGKPRRRDWARGAGVALVSSVFLPWPANVLGWGVAAVGVHVARRQYQKFIADCRQECAAFAIRYCRSDEDAT